MEVEEEGEELGRPLIRNPVVFDAAEDQPTPPARKPMTAMPHAVQAVQDRDAQDVWAELG